MRTTRARKGALFTVGYEGLDLDAYLAVLEGHRVSLLCDVRANPLSRKRGFSKRALAQACEARGLRYQHLPQLGIASAKRKGVQAEEDKQALFAWYEREWLPQQREALAQVRAWLDEGETVALTCFERRAEDCHRLRVAKRLEAGGVRAHHL